MALQELHEGETIFVQGSAKAPYEIRLVDGLVSCSCPSWRNAGGRVRLCKHIRANVLPSCIPVLDQSDMKKIDWDSLPPTTTDSGLYRIVCSANGRFYIGEAKSFKRRWYEHRRKLKRGRHHNPQLQADYGLLGDDAFSFHPYRDIANQSQRRATETQDIRIYLGQSCCYNRSEYSPPSNLGKKQTKEHRAKISVAHKGKTISAETRAKISAAGKGKKASPKTLDKLRSRKTSVETRIKMSAARVGKKHSIATRIKISEANKGRKRTSETRAKMRAAAVARTPEVRARSSAARMGKTASLETRARMSAAGKGKNRSSETRANMRAAWVVRRERKRAAAEAPATDIASKLL